MSIAIFISFIIASFFDFSDPVISTHTSESNNFAKIDLSAGKMLPLIYFVRSTGRAVPLADIPRFVTVNFFKLKSKYIADPSSKKKWDITVTPIQVVPCKELRKNETAFKPYLDYVNNPSFASVLENSALCINISESERFIEGSQAELSSETLVLDFLPCTLGSSCANFSEVTSTGFAVTYPSYNLNFANYEEPVVPNISTENAFFLNPTLLSRYTAKLSTNEIWDDRGFLFNRNLRKSFSEIYKTIFSHGYRNQSQISCTSAEMQSGTCLSYMTISFSSSGKYINMVRNYKTITGVLSQVGGINSIFYILFYTCNMLYFWRAKKRILLGKYMEKLKNLTTSKEKQNRVTNVDDPQPAVSIGEESCHGREHNLDSIHGVLDLVSMTIEISKLKVLVNKLLKEPEKYSQELYPVKIDEEEGSDRWKENPVAKKTIAKGKDIKKVSIMKGQPSIDGKNPHRTDSLQQLKLDNPDKFSPRLNQDSDRPPSNIFFTSKKSVRSSLTEEQGGSTNADLMDNFTGSERITLTSPIPKAKSSHGTKGMPVNSFYKKLIIDRSTK